MRTAAGVTAAVTLALITGCASPGPARQDARALVEARQDQFFAAVADRDADRLAALFADDAVLHVANMPPVSGRAAVAQFYGNMFRFLSGSTATPHALHIAESADLAYGFGSVTNEFRGADGTMAYAGKYALVWRRIDGEWLVALYSVSSDQAAADPRP